ncbi:hypothetical protein CERSUDRAFT_127009 [Gelatoporia subvermispora B]|uniref:Tyrosine specific protein phosphatases domain-containing protein n=1 Tax=Ceriporiopsis subvermispora (strain B) TaxID=914234 RepID=M2QZT8_CERS8|nr:hypothetical protein CERSUDRAFT_127009 [Gelatoporia subvermispora B]
MSLVLLEASSDDVYSRDAKLLRDVQAQDDALVAQLVHLASQHHTSEYNRLKFGPEGAPLAYVPYSIQVPDQVRAWQTYQAKSACQRAWWHCSSEATAIPPVESVDSGQPERSSSTQSTSRATRLKRTGRSVNLRDSETVVSPVVTRQHLPTSADPNTERSDPKTSDSHPLNCSPMIPFTYLHIISTRLVRADEQSPVMFDLPSIYHLNRIISYPPPLETLHTLSSSGTRDNIPSIPPSSNPLPSTGYSLTPGITQKPSKSGPSTWANSAFYRAFHSSPVAKHIKLAKRNMSLPDWTAVIAKAAPPPVELPPTPPRRSANALGDRPKSAGAPKRDRPESQAHPRHPADTHHGHMFSTCRPISPIPDVPTRPAQSNHVTLGNIYLSSCPGKKVRLDGAVNGRAKICRDLRQDLERIRQFGIQCIVCCLDDEELEFLGVPWAEYSSITNSLGMDILRLPIPEFLAPACVRTFDAELGRLTECYILQGRPVLVHCRGGIGRAGLVACCLMLRLGLCGWLHDSEDIHERNDREEDTPSQPSDDSRDPSARCAPPLIGRCPSTSTSTSANSDVEPAYARDLGLEDDETTPPLVVRADILRLLERVIGVVRARRSPKAIETYEQVKFLADYVEHLQGRRCMPLPSSDTP